MQQRFDTHCCDVQTFCSRFNAVKTNYKKKTQRITKIKRRRKTSNIYLCRVKSFIYAHTYERCVFVQLTRQGEDSEHKGQKNCMQCLTVEVVVMILFYLCLCISHSRTHPLRALQNISNIY